MEISNEMVAEACFAYQTQGNMRRALEAAFGQFMLQYGDNVELQEAEQVGFRRAAACIEDLAAALRPFAERNEWDDDLGTAEQPEKANARATLERWGLK